MNTPTRVTMARVAMRAAVPSHPYWCDDCGGKAGFRIPGCPIQHEEGCPRDGEDSMQVYRDAVEYVKRTGKAIP